VMLPMLPFAFPVPSYASEAFHDEAARYFQALGPVLAPLLYPAGPIVMVQIDNEGALYFRDGAFRSGLSPRRDPALSGFFCARSTGRSRRSGRRTPSNAKPATSAEASGAPAEETDPRRSRAEGRGDAGGRWRSAVCLGRAAHAL
jgi:beta-galactosidase